MAAPQDDFEYLSQIHTLILRLEGRRRAIWSARYNNFRNFIILFGSGAAEDELRSIGERLHRLWLEKRIVLSKLPSPPGWSWLSPDIPRCEPLSTISQMPVALRMAA